MIPPEILKMLLQFGLLGGQPKPQNGMLGPVSGNPTGQTNPHAKTPVQSIGVRG